MTRMIVITQRTTVQATMNAVPEIPVWLSMPWAIGAANTMSAAAGPPSTTVAAMSGNARSRFGRNFLSAGASYATSSPVSSAAIPAEALQSATTMPAIRATSEALDDLLAALLTADVNTEDAPGGSALVSPLTSRLTVPAPICISPETP